MLKNTAGQKAVIYAQDTVADGPKTGDAANITAMISKDGAAGVASNDLNPTEVGGGMYVFHLTQAETDCDLFLLWASSTTSGVRIDPVPVYLPARTLLIAPVTSTGNSGLVDDNSLTAYRNACFSFLLTIVDANGDPVDLTGKTLAFLAYPPGNTTSLTIELTTAGSAGDRVVIGGDNGNEVTIEGSDTHTAVPRVLRWVLRDQDGDVVLARGSLTIADEADQAEVPP
jgi:hypothetical protein